MKYRLLLIIWLFWIVTTETHARRRDYDYPTEWESSVEDQDANDGLDGVVSDLRRRQQGRVLSTDTFEEDGRPVHRIRILNEDGRVRPLHFEGDTGRPIMRYPNRHPYGDDR